MPGPYFPVVELKFGTSNFILTIPPQHLQEFTYISRRAGVDEISITFLDATFGRVESEIFKLDRESRPLLFRWGYPGEGLERTRWHRFHITSVSPTISYAGIRITLMGFPLGAEFATLVEAKEYKGRISNVVSTIAKEMGFTDPTKVFIEETNDELNETRGTTWYSGNKTRVDFVRGLANIAKSKSNPQSKYDFKLASDGTFHFHTPLFKKIAEAEHDHTEPAKQRQYRTFNVLFGEPEAITSWRPRFETKIIGTYARAALAGTVDPRSKQFQQRVLDRNSLGLSNKNDPSSGRTSAPPITTSRDAIDKRRRVNTSVFSPTRQTALGGRCSGRTTAPYTEPDRAFAKVENAYKTLQQNQGGGVLELQGIPKYADFLATELYCNINVVLPRDAVSVPGTTGGIHWSSGRYIIDSITHTITSGYIITAELSRFLHIDGSDDGKTGPPRKQQAELIQIR